MIPFVGGEGYGNITKTAGTRIQQLLGGIGGTRFFTYLTFFNYLCGTTAHTVTIMRGHSRTTVNGQVLAAGTTVIVSAAITKSDGTVPAANDAIGIKLDNGTWLLSTISAYNLQTLTYTLNTAVPTGRKILNGARFVLYGVAADPWHALYAYLMTASVANPFPGTAGVDVPLVKAPYPGEPLLFDSNNATAQGTLTDAMVGYGKQ